MPTNAHNKYADPQTSLLYGCTADHNYLRMTRASGRGFILNIEYRIVSRIPLSVCINVY